MYEDDEALLEAYAELFKVKEILEPIYKKVTPNKKAKEQDHMTDEGQTKFQAILEHNKVLFDGELGLFPHKKFHLKLK